MNYKKIHDNIINLSKTREINPTEYYETHHIIPRCLGGKDSKDNLTRLTGREHFIIHQILVKLHPNNNAILHAAKMMCLSSQTQNRSKNKLYSWLRKRLSNKMKKTQKGPLNNQYGKIWIYNCNLKQNKIIKKEELDNYLKNGWLVGRKFVWNILDITTCNQKVNKINKKTKSINKINKKTKSINKIKLTCPINKKLKKRISEHLINEYVEQGWYTQPPELFIFCPMCNAKINAKAKKKYCSIKCVKQKQWMSSNLYEKESQLIELYKSTKSINKSLKLIGLNGAHGNRYKLAKLILRNNGII